MSLSRVWSALFGCLALTSEAALSYEVSTGILHKVEPFESQYVADKNVHIWLPDGYSHDKKYAVLYMHDGQHLFDAKMTWNNQEWGVDEIAGEMQKNGQLKDFIVVGAFNGNDGGRTERMDQYFPQKPFQSLTNSEQKELLRAKRGDSLLFAGNIQSDNYLRFLVSELKPYIDKTYSVHTDKENTFVMGSSMGGLISMYAISEYPEVFGAAACISTHWPGATPRENSPIPQAFFQYMRDNLPDPQSHRLYFDLGTETLDSYYPPLQALADKVIEEKGYDQTNWVTKTFVGAAHDENSWQARLHEPLMFLLGKE